MKKRLPKKIWIPVFCVVLLPVLLVLAVWVATRASVIRGVVLPRVASRLGIPVVVEGISVSPLSRVELRDFRVGGGDRPLLAGELGRVRYDLIDIVRGRTTVHEVTIQNVTVHLIRSPDGTLNLPTFPETAAERDKKPSERRESAPVSVRNVRLEGIDIIYEQQEGPQQQPLSARLTDIALSAPVFGPGKTATCDISGRLEQLRSRDLNVHHGELEGALTVTYDESMRPQDVQARLALAGLQGSAGAIELDGAKLALNAQAAVDGDAWNLESASLDLDQGDASNVSVTASGRLSADPVRLDLDVAARSSGALLSAILAAFSDVSVGAPDIRYRGELRVGNDGGRASGVSETLRVASSGELTASGVAVSSLSGRFPSPGPLSVSVSHDMSYGPASSELSFTEFSLSAEESGGGRVRAGLSAPVSLRLPFALSADAPDADISVRLERFPAALAGLFLRESVTGLSVRDGRIDGDATIRIRDGGGLAETTAELTVADASGAIADRPFAGVTVGARLTGAARPPGSVDLRESALTVDVGGVRALALRAEGAVDRQTGGSVTMTVESLRRPLLDLAPVPDDVRTMLGTLDAKGTLTARLGDKLKDWSAQGHLDLAELMVEKMPDGRAAQLALSGSADVAAGKHQATWRALTLTARKQGRDILSLSSEGRMPIPLERGTVTAQIDVSKLDADALAALAGADSDSAPGSDPGADAEAPDTESEPAPPVDLGGLDADVRASVDSWTYKGLSGEANGRILVADNQIRLRDMSARVANAPVSGEGMLDLSVPGYRYEGTVQISQLGLSPVLAAFAPEVQDEISGRLSELDLAVSGQGTTPTRLLDALSGSATLALDDLALAKWTRLQEAASKWDIPVLGDMNFEAVDAEVTFANRSVKVSSLSATGANQSVSATGSVGFDGTVGLRLDLGLAGPLREKLTDGKLFRYVGPAFEERGEYLFIPVPIAMKGSLSAPRVDVGSLFERVKEMTPGDVLGEALRIHQAREREKEEEQRKKQEERRERKEREEAATRDAPVEDPPPAQGAEDADNTEQTAAAEGQTRENDGKEEEEQTEADEEDPDEEVDGKELTDEERKARRKERRRRKREEEKREREQLKDVGKALLDGLLGGDRQEKGE